MSFHRSCTINKMYSVRYGFVIFLFLLILVTSFSVGTKKVFYFSVFCPKQINSSSDSLIFLISLFILAFICLNALSYNYFLNFLQRIFFAIIFACFKKAHNKAYIFYFDRKIVSYSIISSSFLSIFSFLSLKGVL